MLIPRTVIGEEFELEIETFLCKFCDKKTEKILECDLCHDYVYCEQCVIYFYDFYDLTNLYIHKCCPSCITQASKIQGEALDKYEKFMAEQERQNYIIESNRLRKLHIKRYNKTVISTYRFTYPERLAISNNSRRYKQLTYSSKDALALVKRIRKKIIL